MTPDQIEAERKLFETVMFERDKSAMLGKSPSGIYQSWLTQRQWYTWLCCLQARAALSQPILEAVARSALEVVALDHGAQGEVWRSQDRYMSDMHIRQSVHFTDMAADPIVIAAIIRNAVAAPPAPAPTLSVEAAVSRAIEAAASLVKQMALDGDPYSETWDAIRAIDQAALIQKAGRNA